MGGEMRQTGVQPILAGGLQLAPPVMGGEMVCHRVESLGA